MPLSSRSLRISEGISSGPAALLFFELRIAFSISSLVIDGPVRQLLISIGGLSSSKRFSIYVSQT